jgi:hypothetical protein
VIYPAGTVIVGNSIYIHPLAHTIQNLDKKQPQQKFLLTEIQHGLTAITISPDRSLLAFADRATIFVYDVRSFRKRRAFTVSIDPKSKVMASIS